MPFSSLPVSYTHLVLIFGGDLLRDLVSALTAPAPESDVSVDEEDDGTSDEPEDALERVRIRYADGELSDAEFERRLEILLETGSLGDAERYLAGDDTGEAFADDSGRGHGDGRTRGHDSSRSNSEGHSSSELERSTE
ncbi:SHOCT domain-containing protein [Natrialba chahannaoensis]